MDELIDILTSEGKATGKSALKSEAHHHGWFHATVHIWLFTADEKILLQKRALTKKYSLVCGIFLWQGMLVLVKMF